MSTRTWTAIGLLCLADFVAFAVAAQVLGGDALNGKAEGGRFFLSNHGKVTEVSRVALVYSRYHAMRLFITHPIAFLAA